MDGFNRDAAGTDMAGLSKISVQSGTSHGGVGARRRLDRRREARPRDARAAGRGRARGVRARRARCSTARRRCPTTAFNNFPKRETAEIHLATNFQNMLYDHIPAELRARDLRVAAREREGRAQGDRHRRAVLLQDAQEGARAVQAAAVGPARRGEGEARRSVRREVRVPVRPARRSAAPGDDRRAVREAAGAASPDAGGCDAGARGRAGRRGPVATRCRRAPPRSTRACSGWRRFSARSAGRRTT